MTPLQVGAGIAAFLLKGDLDVEVTKNMEAGMTNYGNGAEFDGVTKAWDIVQENYQCCGVSVGTLNIQLQQGAFFNLSPLNLAKSQSLYKIPYSNFFLQFYY